MAGADQPPYTLLRTELPDAATDPAVCDAVRELNAGYVLDFGEGDIGPGIVQKMPGFTPDSRVCPDSSSSTAKGRRSCGGSPRA